MRQTAVVRLVVVGVGLALLAGCAGVSSQELREGGAADSPFTQITLANVSREKALDRIGDVMKSHGFQAESVNPQLAVYHKIIDSQSSQALWGRSRTIRVSYSLIQKNQDVKISGSISGIAGTHRGILTGSPSSQRTVNLMDKEKYVSFLRELLEEIKGNYIFDSPDDEANLNKQSRKLVNQGGMGRLPDSQESTVCLGTPSTSAKARRDRYPRRRRAALRSAGVMFLEPQFCFRRPVILQVIEDCIDGILQRILGVVPIPTLKGSLDSMINIRFVQFANGSITVKIGRIIRAARSGVNIAPSSEKFPDCVGDLRGFVFAAHCPSSCRIDDPNI